MTGSPVNLLSFEVSTLSVAGTVVGLPSLTVLLYWSRSMEASDKNIVATREWVDMTLKISILQAVPREDFEKAQAENRKEIASLRRETDKEIASLSKETDKAIASLSKETHEATSALKVSIQECQSSKVGWRVYCSFQAMVIGGLLAVIWRAFSQMLS